METKTKATPKLSRVPRGHWRNLYRRPEGFIAKPLPADTRCTVLDSHHYLGSGRWPSREVAEEKARDRTTEHVGIINTVDVWLGAEFFPKA